MTRLTANFRIHSLCARHRFKLFTSIYSFHPQIASLRGYYYPSVNMWQSQAWGPGVPFPLHTLTAPPHHHWGEQLKKAGSGTPE